MTIRNFLVATGLVLALAAGSFAEAQELAIPELSEAGSIDVTTLQSAIESVEAIDSIDEEQMRAYCDGVPGPKMANMVEQASVIITTVGPYQLYGNELVAACAEAGTDYVDLCGEPTWMHEMIAAHSQAAKASGARIVFSCGFDSIPFDLGVLHLQNAMQKSFGKPASRVRGRVRAMAGSWSGANSTSTTAPMTCTIFPSSITSPPLKVSDSVTMCAFLIYRSVISLRPFICHLYTYLCALRGRRQRFPASQR